MHRTSSTLTLTWWFPVDLTQAPVLAEALVTMVWFL